MNPERVLSVIRWAVLIPALVFIVLYARVTFERSKTGLTLMVAMAGIALMVLGGLSREHGHLRAGVIFSAVGGPLVSGALTAAIWALVQVQRRHREEQSGDHIGVQGEEH